LSSSVFFRFPATVTGRSFIDRFGRSAQQAIEPTDSDRVVH